MNLSSCEEKNLVLYSPVVKFPPSYRQVFMKEVSTKFIFKQTQETSEKRKRKENGLHFSVFFYLVLPFCLLPFFFPSLLFSLSGFIFYPVYHSFYLNTFSKSIHPLFHLFFPSILHFSFGTHSCSTHLWRDDLVVILAAV